MSSTSTSHPTTTANPSMSSTSPNPNAAQSISSTSSDEILSSVPTPVIRLLIIFARPIYVTKRTVEILTWRSGKMSESWIVIVGWCALCLCGGPIWVYALPPLLLLPFLPLPSFPTLFPPSLPLQPSLLKSTPSTPATTQTVLLTLSHLHAINGMVPADFVPGKWRERVERWKEMESRRIVRGLAVCWVGWIGLNLLVGGRVTLLLLGSILLLAPSPYLHAFFQLLSKSLFIRRLATLIFLIIFGSPPSDTTPTTLGEPIPTEPFSVRNWVKRKWSTSRRPSFAFQLRPKNGGGMGPGLKSSSLSGSAIAEDTITEEGEDLLIASPPVYFRFELQENQRWWMGLDWTSALLPQERPSWCDIYLNPASPPSSFTLPPESVSFLPEPRKGDPRGKTRRTAKWRWIDEDWSVVKRIGEGKLATGSGSSANPAQLHDRAGSSSSNNKEEHDHPPSEEHPKSKGLAEQALMKGMEKLKQRTLGSVGSSLQSAGTQKARPGSGDYSDLVDKEGGGGSEGGRGSFKDEANRRKSSAASDLATLLGTGNSSNLAYGQNAAVAAAAQQDLDAGTDVEGWSYGDNKWEAMGSKGGMGKYTRRRRWQRRAVCTETVEFISGVGEQPTESVGDVDDLPSSTSTADEDVSGPTVSKNSSPAPALASVVPVHGLKTHSGVTGYAMDASAAPSLAEAQTTALAATPERTGGGKARTESATFGERDNALRQRLKNAMGSVGG